MGAAQVKFLETRPGGCPLIDAPEVANRQLRAGPTRHPVAATGPAEHEPVRGAAIEPAGQRRSDRAAEWHRPDTGRRSWADPCTLCRTCQRHSGRRRPRCVDGADQRGGRVGRAARRCVATHALDDIQGRDYEKIIDALRVVLTGFKKEARIDFGVSSASDFEHTMLKKLGGEYRGKVLVSRPGLWRRLSPHSRYRPCRAPGPADPVPGRGGPDREGIRDRTVPEGLARVTLAPRVCSLHHGGGYPYSQVCTISGCTKLI
jgi:hypothetical protein